jgi:hypothetical protein
MNAAQISRKIFGKYLGTIVTLTAVSLNLITAAFIFSAGVKVVNQYLLFQSSQWEIIMPAALLMMLIFSFNPRNYLHCKAFFTALSFIWVIILFAIGTKEIRFAYLQGTIIHSIDAPNLTSIASVIFFFGGVSHLALFNPEFKEKISYKGTVLVNLLVGLPILIMSIILPLGIWGPDVVNKLSFLQSSTLDTMSVDMFFIERELYIGVPLLFSLIFFNTQNFSFVAYNLLKELNPKSETYAKIVEAIILLMFAVISVRVSLEQLSDWFEKYLKIWLFTYTGIQLLKFISAGLDVRNKK